jgi:hypothetical protein
LWPAPHDLELFGPAFNGADPDIARVASNAVAALEECWVSAPLVLGHDDWEAQHLCFGVDREDRPAVTSIFDVDALAWLPDAVLVGSAAAQHTAGLNRVRIAPTLDEVDTWITRFTRSHLARIGLLRDAWAATAWTIAYNARCDQARRVTGPGVTATCAGQPTTSCSAA